MHLLYEVGVIGLVLILAAVISAFWSAAVSVRRARATASYPLSDSLYFAFAVQVFMIVYAFTSGELVSNIYIAIPYLMCVAIVAARSGTVTELWKESPESPAASHERAGRSHVTSTVTV
jgi:O-antigen ligase